VPHVFGNEAAYCMSAQGDSGQLRHRCREFHASGTGPDEDKRHLMPSFSLIIRCVRQFKCAQNFRPDGLSVAEVLKAWRKSRKFVMTEIARPPP
jgi:hypothetical protein